MRYLTSINDHTFKIEFVRQSDRLDIMIDGQPFEADWEWLGQDRDLSIIVDGRSYHITIEPENGRLLVYYAGERFECDVQDERLAELRKLAGEAGVLGGEVEVKAPMPGLVLRILVESGQEVKKGDRLLIIEAMKMENELKAPRDGVVKEINCTEKDAVEQGKALVVLE